MGIPPGFNSVVRGRCVIGCLVALVVFVAFLMGIALMPRIAIFVDSWMPYFPVEPQWRLLEAVVVMMPFAFLILVVYGCFKWVGRS